MIFLFPIALILKKLHLPVMNMVFGKLLAKPTLEQMNLILVASVEKLVLISNQMMMNFGANIPISQNVLTGL